jgi:hypothetical protein
MFQSLFFLWPRESIDVPGSNFPDTEEKPYRNQLQRLRAQPE